MRGFVGVTLLALLSLALCASAQNWLYVATYEDASCSADKWVSYTSVKIGGGCLASPFPSTNGTQYVKFDCNTLKGAICSDDKCNNCGPSNIDNSAYKTCTGTAANTYTRAFCGDLSAPHPGVIDTQGQYRVYLPSLDCTGPLLSATGFRTGKCIPSGLFGTSTKKFTCGVDGTLTEQSGCNADCSSCSRSETISPACTFGYRTACGVGAASGVAASISFVIMGVLALVALL